MNISAKFQLYPSYGFWGDDFLIYFRNSEEMICYDIFSEF